MAASALNPGPEVDAVHPIPSIRGSASASNPAAFGTTPNDGPRVVEGADGEEYPPAAEFAVMLARPGIPPLASCTDLKGILGVAPKAWMDDFGRLKGRELVAAKVKELEAVTKKSLWTLGAVRRKQKQDASAAKEELIKGLLYLHLRGVR